MLEIGQIIDSNNYGKVKVVDFGSKYRYFIIQFLNTGTRKEYREDQIESGCVRDPYVVNLCGVACTGDIKTSGKYSKYYSIWHDMINRCYNPKNKRYNSYKNVSVCDRWLIFENFYNDRALIEGFDDELINQGSLVLDKDYKQRWSENKVYSVETCIWLDKSLNNKVQDFQQKLFYAKSPDGTIYIADNITQFAREHNLERRHISGVLHGNCKTHKGWNFSYEEIV